jgi:hypothetical protein
MDAVGTEAGYRKRAVRDSVPAAGAVRFHPDRIDAPVRTPAFGYLVGQLELVRAHGNSPIAAPGSGKRQ